MASLYLALSFQAREHSTPTIIPEPTVCTSWGLEDLESDAEYDELSRKPLWGAAVGCLDGSIYIFHPDTTKISRRRSTLPGRLSAYSEIAHIQSKIPAHLSLSRSRNASPMGSRTNLAVPSSKTRAVSGLSKEQAEAPKNFVDFEDEQERMKGMISERAVRDKKDRSSRTAHAPHEPHFRRFDDSHSIISVESSSTLLSPPTSPTLGPINVGSYRKRLALRTRVLPRDFGFQHSVVALTTLEEGELVVSLQKSGKVSLFKGIDGSCITSVAPGSVPPAFKTLAMSLGTGSHVLWRWCSLYTIQVHDGVLVVTVGEADDRTVAPDGPESHDRTRVVIHELSNASEYEFGETFLSKVGDFVFEGCAEGFTVGLDEPSYAIKIYQIDREGAFFVWSLVLVPRSIPLRSTPPVGHVASASRIEASGPAVLGRLPLTTKPRGASIKQVNKSLMGVAWSSAELFVFTVHDTKITLRSIIPLQMSLSCVNWLDENSVALIFSDKIDTYSLPDPATNESCESVEGKPAHTTTILASSISLSSGSIVGSTQHRCRNTIILTSSTDNQQITLLSRVSSDGLCHERRSPIWSVAKPGPVNSSLARRITSVLPIELNSVVVGYDNGSLSKTSINELSSSEDVRPHSTPEIADCAILSLFTFSNTRTGQRVVVGGGDNGSINFWDLATLELRARWILFTEPLAYIVYLEDEDAGRLRGCCLCVSGDGTIAVVAIDSFNFMYLIPGSPAALQTICIGLDNLVLFYVDGRTRLWDVQTGELRRSMSTERAAEMLAQGSWFISDIEDRHPGLSIISVTNLNRSSAHGDPPPMSVFDIGAILDVYTRSAVATSAGHVGVDGLKVLLAILHTPGLDEQADRSLASFVGSQTRDNLAVGSYDQFSFRSFFLDLSHGIWQISPEVTASRLLTIVALLSALSTTEAAATTLLPFYTVMLPSVVGVTYRAPNLAVLAHYWNESESSDVRSAAKQLFENEVSRLPDESINAVTEKWRHKLPCLLPEDQRQSSKAALALSICGNIAIERYALLSSTTLSDIAKSVMIYFNDATSPHRVLAIDLCSRGFEIWQQYFDSMEALRSLFVLATTSRKDAISIKNPGPYARMAVLHIASSNSPLFVTTLSLDILHPRSIEYSKSVLQIIAFLIRKKPLVLFPNLPRMMEAVVKSLDPGHNAEREAVLDSVTEIIALVVQTFPTLDFHAGSQRLAVGTNEGAVIMYDLKTATRLYVLEGHRKRLTGISFSPDGRRMVTLSVEESALLVWKVGSSFTSFFHPGAPPRQGRSGSEPYKTLSFVLQDNASMTLEESLKQVHFSWPSDRSVRVHIRDAVFTFST